MRGAPRSRRVSDRVQRSPDRAATTRAARAASGSGQCRASPRRYRLSARVPSSGWSSRREDQAGVRPHGSCHRPRPRLPHEFLSPSNNLLPSSPSLPVLAKIESDLQQLGNPLWVETDSDQPESALVAQECSDGYYCRPPPQSEIPENDQISTNSGLLEVRQEM